MLLYPCAHSRHVSRFVSRNGQMAERPEFRMTLRIVRSTGLVVCLLALCSCERSSHEPPLPRPGLVAPDCLVREMPRREVHTSSSARATPALDAEDLLAVRPCLVNASQFTISSLGRAGELWRLLVDPVDRRHAVRLWVTSPTSGVELWSQVGDGRTRPAEIGFVADGGGYEVRVETASQLGLEPISPYLITLERMQRSTDDCCSVGAGPGCAADILTCLCDLDNRCCLGEYDTVCVAEAKGSCDVQCVDPAAQDDCCHPSTSGGCSVTPVEECVCDIDPYCCAVAFDRHCVALGNGRCRANCSRSEGANP
jgi:hypothetical protein